MKQEPYPPALKEKIETIRASLRQLEDLKGVPHEDVEFLVVLGRPPLTFANETAALAARMAELAMMENAP